MEHMRGTATQARDYCRNDGNFTEAGSIVLASRPRNDPGPQEGQTRRGTRADRRADAYKQLRSKTTTIRQLVNDTPDDVAWIHSIARYGRGRTGCAKLMFLHGATETGKSTSIDRVCGRMSLNYYKKPPSDKWFDGYMDESLIVTEEFRTCFTLSSMLVLVDINPPPLQVKGGYMPNMATHIIITSNLPPEKQYVNCDEACRAAFMRRCNPVICTDDMSFADIEYCIEKFLAN